MFASHPIPVGVLCCDFLLILLQDYFVQVTYNFGFDLSWLLRHYGVEKLRAIVYSTIEYYLWISWIFSLLWWMSRGYFILFSTPTLVYFSFLFPSHVSGVRKEMQVYFLVDIVLMYVYRHFPAFVIGTFPRWVHLSVYFLDVWKGWCMEFKFLSNLVNGSLDFQVKMDWTCWQYFENWKISR